MAKRKPAPEPQDPDAVQQQVRSAFEAATSSRQRARVVEGFVASYPHLAFHPLGWLHSHWMQWRVNQQVGSSTSGDRDRREACQMLAAVKRGVSAPIHGYVGGWLVAPEGKAQLRMHRVKQARHLLREVSRDDKLRESYKTWREGRGDPAYDRYLAALERRALRLVVDFDPTPPEAESLQPNAWSAPVRHTHATRAVLYQPYFDRFRQNVRSRGLARALSALIAQLHRVRERDLH